MCRSGSDRANCLPGLVVLVFAVVALVLVLVLVLVVALVVVVVGRVRLPPNWGFQRLPALRRGPL